RPQARRPPSSVRARPASPVAESRSDPERRRPAANRAGPGTARDARSCPGLRALVDQHVALLVFLPAPAWTGVVAADARPGPHRNDPRRLGLSLPPALGATGRLPRRARERAAGLGVLGHHLAWSRPALDLLHRLGGELHAEQALDELVAHLAHQRLEQGEGLLLILDQRVALPVGPKPDPALQVVELVEMVAPVLVEGVEVEMPLDVAQ